MAQRISQAVAGLCTLVLLALLPLGFAWADDTIEVQGTFADRWTPTHTMTFRYPASIQANADVTFAVSASGGVGDYKYRPYSLSVKNGTSWQDVVTFNMQGFSPENTSLTYSFSTVGTYRLQWTVMDRVPDTESQWMMDSFYVDFDVTGEGITSAEREQRAAQIAEEVWQQCQAAGCTTEYDIALWLHDWVIDHCEYDSTYLHYTPTDLFVDGRGTCEAYHGAYMQLLQKAGIQTSRVEDGGHVWTGVRIDGIWCHVDTTSDDSDRDWYGLGALNRHRFFGIDDATIQAKLATDGGEIKRKTPDFTAMSLKNSYIVRSGIISSYESPLIGPIQEKLDQGSTSFSVPIPPTTLAPSYKALIYVPVAEDLSSKAWTSKGAAKALAITYADDALHITANADTVKPAPEKPASSGSGQSGSGGTQAASIPMHRLYNPNSGEHFYTASAHERDSLVRVGWRYEGIGWYAPASGQDVYRLYNSNAGDHHYTANVAERDSLIKAGWRYEGVGWKSGGTVPLYRQYNPQALAGSHNYTTNKAENDMLVGVGWRSEGIGWYGVR